MSLCKDAGRCWFALAFKREKVNWWLFDVLDALTSIIRTFVGSEMRGQALDWINMVGNDVLNKFQHRLIV